MKKLIFFFLILNTIGLFAQRASISYESNGKTSTLESNNPFAKFIGEWTLKNDDWSQNWGGKTEHIKIPNHHTVSAGINTKNSLISIIDGPEPNGHIFWSYNPNTKEVEHLSSFGDIRAGHGKGTIDGNGDLRLKLSFEGESKNTYRIYNYKWVNDDEYHMKSVQYDVNDKQTGLFYEGTFMRVNPNEKLRQEIEDILSVLDNYKIAKEEQIKVYTEDVVHMSPNHEAITNKEALLSYLKEQAKYGYSNMTHKIIDYDVFDDIVIMQGQVIGKFYPKSGKQSIDFRTKNLFVFKRVNGKLKIWKIIYNMSKNEFSDDLTKSEIIIHGEVIRKAFSAGDIEKIKALHHPDVVKALGYNDLKTGREAVIKGLRETLANYNLEFIENDIEEIFVKDDIAIEQTKFSIKGTPKQGGESFIFSGRTMVTYVQYADSPTGWATIREIIQPSN